MPLYGFGDAQIDAQNRATQDIGAIKAEYNNTKAAGQLTAGYINTTKSRLQSVVDTYKAAYGNTSRGAAGGVTLQTFLDTMIYPELDADMATVSPATSTTPSWFPTFMQPSSTPSTPSSGVNVNITAPGSSATPIAMGPSASPGPPPGIEIPGTTVDVSAPDWLKNPLLWAGLALAAFYVMRER